MHRGNSSAAGGLVNDKMSKGNLSFPAKTVNARLAPRQSRRGEAAAVTPAPGGRDAAASGFRARTPPPGGGRAGWEQEMPRGRRGGRRPHPRGEGAGPAPGRKPTGGRRAHPASGGACRRPKGPSRVSRAARRRVERALPVCPRRRRGRSGPRTPCGRGGGKGAGWIVRRRQVLTDRPSRRAEPLLPVRGSRASAPRQELGAGERRCARSWALPGGHAGVR